MFTGLVTDVGTITKAEHRNGLTLFEVEGGYPADGIELGASIMHSGVCLTVIKVDPIGETRARWQVEAVPETLERSVLGKWTVGTKTNLERSLKMGDELGGHFVFGHVDGVGEIISIEPEGQSYRVTVRPPSDIARYFAEKGSVAIDGVSLTVAAAHDNGDFEVAVIPHTWEVTNLGDLKEGSNVNLEIDMLARYVARMIGADAPKA